MRKRHAAVGGLFLLSACASVPAANETAPAVFGGKAEARCGAPPAVSEARPEAFFPPYRLASLAWTPPPPMPEAPPERPDILAMPEPVLRSTGDPKVDAHRAKILGSYASQYNWRPYLTRLLAGVCADPSIVQNVETKPQSAAEAVQRYFTPDRIREGRRLYQEMQARAPFTGEAKVPLEVLLAMWAVASDYGRSMPRYDMLQAQLMRGAYNPLNYPEAFEIYDAARIILSGADRTTSLAYADGRVGQVRMLPGDYFRWAKDGDGDGRADIWRNGADILKSFNDLMSGVWEPGVPIMVEIEAPKLDPNDPGDARFLQAIKSGQGVRPQYFRRVDGQPWPSDAWGGTPVTPFGASGPTFLMTRSAWAVNVASPFRERYGDFGGFELPIAVGLLADAIAGRPGPSRPIRG